MSRFEAYRDREEALHAAVYKPMSSETTSVGVLRGATTAPETSPLDRALPLQKAAGPRDWRNANPFFAILVKRSSSSLG